MGTYLKNWNALTEWAEYMPLPIGIRLITTFQSDNTLPFLRECPLWWMQAKVESSATVSMFLASKMVL